MLADLWLDDGFSGRDLIARARVRFPACRFALMSTRRAPADLPPTVAFVPKPVTEAPLRALYRADPPQTAASRPPQ